MIDLNQIRSLKPLEEMKKDLTDFIGIDRAVMLEVYEEHYQWGEEDYEADLEQVKDLLEQVEKRIKSLGHHLSKPKAKVKVNYTRP
jgi:predicted nucleotidyltransferase component of viral defense system